MVVDSDRTNFEDLVELVVEKYPPGYMESAHIQYYVAALKTFPEIQNYVDLYYSVEKFRLAYSQPIPAMPDKSQWPKSTHEFFIHPPLLMTIAGRTKTERYKDSGEKKKKEKVPYLP